MHVSIKRSDFEDWKTFGSQIIWLLSKPDMSEKFRHYLKYTSYTFLHSEWLINSGEFQILLTKEEKGKYFLHT